MTQSDGLETEAVQSRPRTEELTVGAICLLNGWGQKVLYDDLPKKVATAVDKGQDAFVGWTWLTECS